MTPRMRVKIFCAVVSLLAALSQRDLPYHADKGMVHSACLGTNHKYSQF